jgi:hypothetical protein
MDTERRLISRRQLREMEGGVSLMTIFRRERTVPGYPQPVLIRARAFYWNTDVERYYASLRRWAENSGSSARSAPAN